MSPQEVAVSSFEIRRLIMAKSPNKTKTDADTSGVEKMVEIGKRHRVARPSENLVNPQR